MLLHVQAREAILSLCVISEVRNCVLFNIHSSLWIIWRFPLQQFVNRDDIAILDIVCLNKTENEFHIVAKAGKQRLWDSNKSNEN